MLEISPIMLATCFSLSSPYYAQSYANIIDNSLLEVSNFVDFYLFLIFNELVKVGSKIRKPQKGEPNYCW